MKEEKKYVLIRIDSNRCSGDVIVPEKRVIPFCKKLLKDQNDDRFSRESYFKVSFEKIK